jgi:hypothetical protein
MVLFWGSTEGGRGLKLPTVTSVTSVTRTCYPNDDLMLKVEKGKEKSKEKKVHTTCLQVSSYTSYSLASQILRECNN